MLRVEGDLGGMAYIMFALMHLMPLGSWRWFGAILVSFTSWWLASPKDM